MLDPLLWTQRSTLMGKLQLAGSRCHPSLSTAWGWACQCKSRLEQEQTKQKKLEQSHITELLLGSSEDLDTKTHNWATIVQVVVWSQKKGCFWSQLVGDWRRQAQWDWTSWRHDKVGASEWLRGVSCSHPFEDLRSGHGDILQIWFGSLFSLVSVSVLQQWHWGASVDAMSWRVQETKWIEVEMMSVSKRWGQGICQQFINDASASTARPGSPLTLWLCWKWRNLKASLKIFLCVATTFWHCQTLQIIMKWMLTDAAS